MTGIIIGLVLIAVAAQGLRWAYHKFLGAPLDPEAEREKLRQDLARGWRISKKIAKHYLRR
jgi:hypothetical protein